ATTGRAARHATTRRTASSPTTRSCWRRTRPRSSGCGRSWRRQTGRRRAQWDKNRTGGRMVRPLRWCLARRKRIALTLLGVPLVLLNVVVYLHARAFTHYAPRGAATARPERLDRWQKARVLLTGVTIPRPE